MPMLALNGVTIPTAFGGQAQIQEIGERNRAFDGTMLRDYRNIKRNWNFTTTPLTDLQFVRLKGMLLGQGYTFPFNGDLYAANGLGGSGNITQFSGGSADGAPVQDENGVYNNFTGLNSVAGEGGGAINLLTNAAQTNPSSTANWFAASATLSLDTSNFYVGTQSLKIVTSAVSLAGAQNTPTIAGSLNTTYTFSFYVKGTGTYLAYIFDSANGNAGAQSVAVAGSSSYWRRVSVTYTTVSSGATPALNVRMCVGDSLAKTFYCGGAQLEASGSTSSYVAAGSSRTATSVSYAQSPMGPAGMTVNWWQTKPQPGVPFSVAFSASDGSFGNVVKIYAPTDQTKYNLDVATAAGSASLQVSGLSYTYAWHMMTAVIRTQPEAGEHNLSLYKDGVLLGTADTAYLPTSLAQKYFWIGTDQGNNPSYFRIGQMDVLPYPVDAIWLTARFSAGGTLAGSTPLLTATGSFVPETSVTVVGKIDDVKVQGFRDASGVWHQNGRIISFTLDEL